MRNFTKRLWLTLALLVSVVFVFAQDFSHMTPAEREMANTIKQQPPAQGQVTSTMAATPISTFPFDIDFEGGTFPAEIEATAGTGANIGVQDYAANGSSYGASLEGNTYSGWHYPYNTGDAAFNNSPTHIASMNMEIHPDPAQTGMIFMTFDLRQNYSYNKNYSWFRVTVNGTPIPDVDGNIYHQPSTPEGDAWATCTYDLSPYQGSDFSLTLETANKYYYHYYRGGDVAMIDNIHFEYIAVGTIEGHVYANGSPLENATVGIVDLGVTYTDASGYYSFPNILTGDYQVYAFMDGMNQDSASVTLTAGQTLVQDFDLTPPIMIISPLSFTETLNPEEYLTDFQGIQNAGAGGLYWSATIQYPTKNTNASYPKYGIGQAEIEYGQVNDPLATDRKSANDHVVSMSGSRDVGDVVQQFTPQGLQAWGICFDGTYLYVTDPFGGQGNIIHQMNTDGTTTGYTINANFGGSWIGDMSSDGTYIYACNVGGDNAIKVIDIATGTLVNSISGAWTSTSQRGLGHDEINDEFYIGGWNSDNIWRVDASGATISEHSENGVSGLAYHPQGGPDATGSLWVVDNDPADPVNEYDPNNGWALLQNFTIPGGSGHSGAGLGLNGNGNLWIVNQGNNVVYEVETGEPLTLGPNWLSLSQYSGHVAASGGSMTIGVNFDASGTQAGDVYTADIIYSADPNVSQTTVPVTMIVAGDPLTPCTDLEATLVSQVTGQVDLTWTYAPTMDPTFQYFLIRRNGTPIANTTNTTYTDMLPAYGTYSYTVAAVYAEGETTPAGPAVVEWLIPALCYTPASLYNEQWPDVQEQVTLTLENCGDGTLAFSFPDYLNNNRGFSCNNQVALYDSYGDGWNGGALDVLVNGVVVLDHITLNSGSGPEYFSFPVEGGDDISTVYYPGSWSNENSYDLIDGDGNVMYHSGNSSIPPGIVFGTCPVPSFIVDVEPAQGQIVSGETMEITLTYSSAGFPVGDYDEYLHIETNDPDHEVDSILNTMHVYTPAQLYGTVTDCNTGAPMAGVDVTASAASDFTTTTDENGYYEMYVDEDTYDVTFELLGFQTQTVSGVFAPEGVMTEVSTTMCEMPYPVPFVYADPNQNDTECLVTWSLPEGPYEIIYDDGTAEDYVVWTAPGNAIAVKFTPAGYPATVTGGRLFVGDGSFPANANFIGSQFAIGVLDDDGANGMPGTVLDSIVVDVNNYNWVQFEGLNSTFNDGDFYIVMWQLAFPPNAAPVGVDNQIPTVYRSYVKVGNNDWAVSPYQDFMVRAIVSGPNAGVTMNASAGNKMIYPPKTYGYKGYLATGAPKGIPGTEKTGIFRPVVSEATTRDLTDYTVALVDGFDPDAGQTPEDGTITPITNTGNTSYNHTGWGGLAEGWYAYAVRANYDSGDQSDWTYSNVVGHLKDVSVTITVQLCNGAQPSDAEVTLVGHNYPYNTYMGLTDTNGVIVFDSVIKGNYDLFVSKVGYQDFEHLGRSIFVDYSENVMLQKNAYPVRNLYVDPLTSLATWDEPLITQMVNQDFEDETFPPEGWQKSSNGAGWIRSDDGGSQYFPVPPGDGFYAVTNDDLAGSSNNGDMDYLITPMMDLRESDSYKLYFDHFFTGEYSETATVEYSLDDGATWEVLQTMNPVTDWTPVEVDLSSLSGLNGASAVRFAFHANDNGEWASGWAVDNVAVHNGAAPVASYIVYLDDVFVIELPATQRSYAFENLTYGTTYTAAVVATYGTFCEQSEKVYYTWTSSYLYPPRNLGDDYLYGTNEVPLKWNPPMTDDGIPMSAAQSTVVYEGPQEPVANADQATTVTRIEFDTPGSSRDTWDLQFAWPTYHNDGEAGVESDGMYIYTAKWNGDRFTKYGLDGTFVEDFTISGVSNVRDMAYDGQYFYGGAASTTVFVMDFENQALVSTFVAPVAVRAIAYNDDDDVFYANNWSDNITMFDASGNNLGSFSPAGLSGIYGMAYDNWSDGGPFLWVYDQGANNLTQFQLPAGTPTGFTVDVQSITGSTSSAGGLFTQPEIVSGTVTIGGNSQNEQVWGMELAPFSPGPVPGVVPDGLVSFNVYRDADSIANVPYNGEGTNDTIRYIDNGLMPGTYLYDVSALYDLSVFGFPGQFGESAWEGTDTVNVIWGMELPFYEDWTQGTFEFNNWTTDSENWGISSQVGNDAPSAEFTWDPQLQNGYSSALTSAPMNADMLTEGNIWLDYDIKLDSRNNTGDEKILVEVYDGQSWTQVAEVSNANGSFGFEDGHNHIDISNHAMGRVFQVRFNAVGENSFDIISWFVDNISVYRTCAAPKNLTGKYEWHNAPPAQDDFGALITWEAPDLPVPVQGWIHWDDGTNASAIGLTDDGPFSVAARWDAGMLSDWEGQNFDGTYITKVQYFISDDGYTSVELKIWTGANASTLIWSQDVTSSVVIGMWNEYELDTPIQIDASLEYWVGYTVNGIGGKFPAGTDAGPAVAGYGDMVSLDGTSWDLLSGFGLDYNWNVEFYAEEMETNIPAPAPVIDNTVYTAQSASLAQGAVKETRIAANRDSERDFQGFNLYRRAEEEPEFTLYANIPYVDGQTSYEYYDQYPNVSVHVGYSYKVTAVWSSDIDNCESEPARAQANPMSDTVYVYITGIDNPLAKGLTNIYPNPAKDRVTVTSSEAMTHITVVNYLGQVVYNSDVNDATTLTLNTSSYESGVYVVRIDTENGQVTKRVTIAR